jgi:hypothetical protein
MLLGLRCMCSNLKKSGKPRKKSEDGSVKPTLNEVPEHRDLIQALFHRPSITRGGAPTGNGLLTQQSAGFEGLDIFLSHLGLLLRNSLARGLGDDHRLVFGL